MQSYLLILESINKFFYRVVWKQADGLLEAPSACFCLLDGTSFQLGKKRTMSLKNSDKCQVVWYIGQVVKIVTIHT